MAFREDQMKDMTPPFFQEGRVLLPFSEVHNKSLPPTKQVALICCYFFAKLKGSRLRVIKVPLDKH